MLILSRKIGESVMMGDDIKVTVLSIHGNTVKIGITAPKTLKIYREELYESIAKENIESTATPINEFKGMFEEIKSLKEKKKND